MKMCKLSLLVAGLLVCYSNAVVDQIIIDFAGNVTSVGSSLLEQDFVSGLLIPMRPSYASNRRGLVDAGGKLSPGGLASITQFPRRC
jgi:hypothetical protein